MKKLLARLLVLLFLGSLLSANAEPSSSKNSRLLLIVSHGMEHKWSQDFANSLAQGLGNCEIAMIELNAMRGDTLQDWNKLLAPEKSKIQSKYYDAIITLDTQATALAAQNVEKPSATPIVYAGYLDHPSALIQANHNITGVNSFFDIRRTIETGMKLMPKTQKIIVITDTGEQPNSLKEHFQKQLIDFNQAEVVFLSGNELPIQDFWQMIRKMPKEHFIVVSPLSLHKLNYQTDVAFGVDLDRSTPRPFFILTDSLLGLGAAGGYLSCGKTLGQETTQLLRQVLEKGSAVGITPTMGSTEAYYDQKVLTKYDLDSKRLPEGAKIINQPQSLWHDYRRELLLFFGGCLFFVGITITFSALLAFYRRKIDRRNNAIFHALPGRTAVCTSDEKILFINDELLSDKLCIRRLHDLPNIDYQRASESIGSVFKTNKPLSFEYEFMDSFRIVSVAPLNHDVFGQDAVVWFSSDNMELQKAHKEIKAVTAELKSRTKMWELLIDMLPMHIYAKDASNDFRYVFSNRASCKFYGLNAEELSGKNDFEILPAEIAAKLRQEDTDNMRTTECREKLIDLPCADGKIHHMQVLQIPCCNDDGTQLLIGAAIDVTELLEAKSHAEENAEYLRLTLQSIGDAVIATDTNGKIIMLNSAAEQLTGWTAEKAKGKPHQEVFCIVDTLTNQQLNSPVDKALATEEIINLSNHTDLISVSGDRHHIADSAAPIKDARGKTVGVILVFRDVTGDYEKRDQLRNALTALEYASEMSHSAAFSFDVTTHKMTGSKLLPKLWPIDENGVAAKMEDWVYHEDSSKLRLQWDNLVSSGNETIVLDYRSNKRGEMRYYRMMSSADRSNPHSIKYTGVIQDVTEITQNAVKFKDTLDLWNQVINSIPTMFFAKNADDNFRYLLCNKAFASMFGKTPEEVVGKTDAELFPLVKDVEWFNQLDSRIMAMPEGDEFSEEATDSFGILHHFQTTKKPFIETNGRRLLLGAAHDISKLNALMTNEKVVNSCFEALLAEADTEKVIVQILQTICSHVDAYRGYIFRFDIEKHEISCFSEYTPPGETSLLLQFQNKPYEAKPSWEEIFSYSESISLNDIQSATTQETLGGWHHLAKAYDIKSLHAHRIIIGGKLWGYLGLVYKEKPHKLSDSEQQFVRSVAHFIELMILRIQTQKQLVDAVEKAQSADRAKSYFLASMSHEIRTPLNAVIGFSELLKDGGISQEAQKEYVQSISGAGSSLLELINDVLDLSKLEAGQMLFTPEETDFGNLANEVCNIFSLKRREKGLEGVMDIASDMPLISVDKLRLRQILFNLVGNAIKFTNTGRITVSSSFTPDSDTVGTLEFHVIDTGIGIAEEEQRTLFDPFIQSKSMRGTYAANNGTGLGLAIVRRMLLRMDGEIYLKSEQGVGSDFCVKINNVHYRTPSESTSLTNAAADDILVGLHTKVLLVDDIVINLKVMNAILRKLGAEVVIASSGNEALEKMQQETPDIVLTDLWMPGMNGAELARRIHASYPNIPVVAVTADADSRATFDMDVFNGILLKPITTKSLHSLLISKT